MKFYKNINELVESLTKDIVTDNYEFYQEDDEYIDQLGLIYNSSCFKPCRKELIDQFISLLNDEDNIKNLLLPKILIDRNINIIYNGLFKEQIHDYGHTLDFMYISNKKSIVDSSKYKNKENSDIKLDYNYHTDLYKSILYTDYMFNMSSLDDSEERFWLRVFRKIINKIEKEYGIVPDMFIYFEYNNNYPYIDLKNNDGKTVRIQLDLEYENIRIIDLDLLNNLENIFIEYKNDIIDKEMNKKKYDPVLFEKYIASRFGFNIYETITEEKKNQKNIFKRLFDKNY